MFGHVWAATDQSQRCDMNKLLPQNVRDIIRDIVRDMNKPLPQKLVVLLYMDSESVFDLPSLIDS
jgi:hypothetical protein